MATYKYIQPTHHQKQNKLEGVMCKGIAPTMFGSQDIQYA